MESDKAQIRLQCAQELAIVTRWSFAEAAAAFDALSAAVAQCGSAKLERRMRTPLTAFNRRKIK